MRSGRGNRQALRDECAEALWRHVSANALKETCRRLGLDVTRTDREPMDSKRAYVSALLAGEDDGRVLEIAERIVEDHDDFWLRERIDVVREADGPGVTEITRRRIIEALEAIELGGRVPLVDFLLGVWPLETMDSHGTFSPDLMPSASLAADIHQHCVRFPERTNGELLDQLGLLTCSNALLFRFLEALVHPRTRDEADQRALVARLDPLLRRDGFGLREVMRLSGSPVFGVRRVDQPGEAPSAPAVSAVLEAFNGPSVHAAWAKASERMVRDPEGAITMARTLLETVCKHILDDYDAAYSDKDDLPKLWKACGDVLDLSPSRHADEPIRRILGGCASVVEGIGTLRNRVGDAHGQGKRAVRPTPRHAALVVNLAGAMAMFVLETVEARKRRSAETDGA